MIESKKANKSASYLAQYNFESSFFERIAESKDYRIISFGARTKKAEIEAQVAEFIQSCAEEGVVPVIMVVDASITVVSSPKTTITGIMSEYSLQGFEC
jgi:hypothetical protein